MGREGSTQGKGLACAGAVTTEDRDWAVRFAPARYRVPGRRPTRAAGSRTYIGLAQRSGAGSTLSQSSKPGIGRSVMNAMRIVGVLLLVVGLAGFLTGGFSFTKDTTQAKLGPLELTVKEKESVNIPQWMSLGAMVLGGVVLVLGFRKN